MRNLRGGVTVATHEFGRLLEGQVQDVVEDEHLTIAVRACTDADGRRLNFSGDHGRYFARDAFQINAGHAGAIEGNGVPHQVLDGSQVFSLYLVAAHHVYRLRRQANVTGDWNFGVDNAANQVGALFATLDFHCFRARFLDVSGSIAHGVIGTDVIRAIRHISDEERVRHAAADSFGVVQHLGE